MNSFGRIFRLSSFGESHGAAVGGVIDGVPAGVEVDLDFIQKELNRRRPGQSALVTQRNEADEVELLSGVFEGKTTGTPIGFFVRNKQQLSEHYENLKGVFRPSHADYTYHEKYGIRDYRGGGRASARETIARVVAGAFAKLVLREFGIKIVAYTSQIGGVKVGKLYNDIDEADVEKNAVRCPDEETAAKMADLILQTKNAQNSIGGVVTCVISGVKAGLGEPVFDKLHARLGYAMLSINAVKGFDLGSGFEGLEKTGFEANDFFRAENGEISTLTNNSGGVQGGISNGEQIYFRVAFKPTPTISLEQETVSVEGENITLKAHGRHDPCVVTRAVAVVESMAAMTILDFILLAQKDKILLKK